jgi:hypothetical protein
MIFQQNILKVLPRQLLQLEFVFKKMKENLMLSIVAIKQLFFDSSSLQETGGGSLT